MCLWENTSPSSSRSVPARSTSPVPVQDRCTEVRRCSLARHHGKRLYGVISVTLHWRWFGHLEKMTEAAGKSEARRKERQPGEV
ncbi:uncharacterized protein LOC113901489 isoform X2 [Bos indicus x Bos taurus]|nr:uncharacterized protein LOC113901489 isoform X2 [Bos indicus x Bos taurus]